MVTQGIYFLYQFLMLFFLVASFDLKGDLSHTCAYSNESVVKFRKSILGINNKDAVKICLTEKISVDNAPHFDWPIDLCDFWISSLFGMRTLKGVTKMHQGIDLASLKGTAVKSACAGKVIKAEKNIAGYGTLVEIQHAKGFSTRYGHMQEILVNVGDQVKQGDLIGTVGSLGNVSAKKDPSHLHFEIRKQGKSLNPLKYLYCSEAIFIE